MLTSTLSRSSLHAILLSLLISHMSVVHTYYKEAIAQGSDCDLGVDDDDDDELGTCVEVRLCRPALQAIKRTGTHDFNRCGFIGKLEIICCPNDTISHVEMTTKMITTTVTSMGSSTSAAEVRAPKLRKSKLVCDELANRIAPKVTPQILGGVDAEPGEFPHMAALGYEGDTADQISWQCGGSLISDRYILTAAHCIVKQDQKRPIRIRMGKIDIVGDTDNLRAQDFGIANMTIHPNYNRRTRQNDVALIQLDSAVTTNENVNPACLYNRPDDPEKGLVITGWGVVKIAGESKSILQKGFLEPVALKDCNASYLNSQPKFAIYSNQVCAKSSNSKTDACQGDSGGPLQIQSIRSSSIYSIVGITSFGRGCGGSFPGIYARVYSYLDWIEEIVWPEK